MLWDGSSSIIITTCTSYTTMYFLPFPSCIVSNLHAFPSAEHDVGEDETKEEAHKEGKQEGEQEVIEEQPFRGIVWWVEFSPRIKYPITMDRNDF